jgi:hypothetical protein
VDILNRFFVSVFTEEGSGEWPELSVMFSGEEDEKLKNMIITEDIVLEKLQKLNASKAPGADSISPALLVGAAESLAFPLAVMFQTSLDSGENPDAWKVANVVPIFKKGQSQNLEITGLFH